MNPEIRILILEDDPSDAKLMELELLRAGIAFVSERVDTRGGFVQALDGFKPDIILADYKLPAFDGLSAVNIVQETHPEVPVIMVSGGLSDETAVDLLKAGAKDYILKDRMGRLASAILRTLSEKEDNRKRKLAEEKYRALFAKARDGIVLLECGTGIVVDCNPEFELMSGKTLDELKGQEIESLYPVEIKEAERKKLLEVVQSGVGGKDELSLHRPNGEIIPAEVSASVMQVDGQCYVQGIVRDISERKQAQNKLQRINRALRTISICNQLLIHATDELQLLNDMCRIITKNAGYRMAWVGFAGHDEQKTVLSVATSGCEADYPERAQMTLADNEYGLDPAGIAIRTQKPCVIQDAQTDPAYLPWRGHSIECGYRAVLALPLTSQAQVIGALTICSSECNGFTEPEVQLLGELADDLAFGIITLRTRILKDQGAARLLRSFENSIAAMATIVEIRDPYTAGHQRRVAELSEVIARELGLPDEDVHGIYLAALIHDLGKIQVPPEILIRPGKLTDLQFKLIQTHSEAGYDILKQIDPPWAIKEMVYQHHERLDGSGYPNGLKAAEITLGAQIIAVADTVEAMSSHRPYRAALGIDVALEEIEKNRGRTYNTEVVDACIQQFWKKGFAFSSQSM
ncbi:MAG: HD domain-containing protein [Methylococcales bacterium]|nr:HD domain-containing protein [Methylococcales bacterium]